MRREKRYKQPGERSKRGGSRAGSCFGFFLLLIIATGIWGLVVVNQKGTENRQVRIDIPEGGTVGSVLPELQEKGVVSRPVAFHIFMSIRGLSGRLKPGIYRLSQDLSIRELANTLISGPSKTEGSVTLIEGWTNVQIADELTRFFLEEGKGARENKDKDTLKRELLAEMSNLNAHRNEFAFLREVPPGRTLEGYLFPDTYAFFYTATPKDVVRKLLLGFDARVTIELRTEARLERGSLFDAVRFASIVQQEAGMDDFASVAGVFANRLKNGQKLESDATVNYVTNKKSLRPTIEDTRVDSPYNTYTNKGLPFGPIGNPSLAALTAAIHPAQHTYLFFLTESENGKAIFGKTFAEHQENVKTYLRK